MDKRGVLSLCASCRHAEWDKAANGRRHPNGSGRCLFQLPDSPLPKWAVERGYGSNDAPMTRLSQLLEKKLHGRWVYWRETFRTEPTPCATWSSK
jgi:hypothetical protein